MLHLLEVRRLLSSSVVSGVLTINGNDSGNVIAVSLSSGKLKVSESGAADKFYTTASVNKIQVNGNGGGDSITIDTSVTQPSTLKGGGGNDTITGSSRNDLIEGNSGNDSLKGGAGNDGIFGGSGNDTIQPGSGVDVFEGDSGTDSVTFADRIGPLTLEIHVAWDDVITCYGGIAGESELFLEIESIQGSMGADTLNVTSSLGEEFDVSPITIDGGAGADRITFGQSFADRFPPATLRGGSGNDRIIDYSMNKNKAYGDSGDDVYTVMAEVGFPTWFAGGSGKDRVDGEGQVLGGGSITMPSDLEEVVDFNDVKKVTGNSLNNYIQVSGNAMSISGEGGNDVIYGGSQDDTLLGQAGNDTIYGNAGNDRIFGGSGNDSLRGGSGNDRIYAEAGADIVYGESGNDKIYAVDSTKDSLYGGSGTDSADCDSTDVLNSIESAI